jgi:hypothetical protein
VCICKPHSRHRVLSTNQAMPTMLQNMFRHSYTALPATLAVLNIPASSCGASLTLLSVLLLTHSSWHFLGPLGFVEQVLGQSEGQISWQGSQELHPAGGGGGRGQHASNGLGTRLERQRHQQLQQ